MLNQSNQMNQKKLSYTINPNLLMIIVAMYLVATANFSFFRQVLSIYPFSSNTGFILSIAVLLFSLLWLLLQLFSHHLITKAMLIFMLIIASICSYFTDSYGTIFDTNMLVNGLQTDQAEVMDLLSISFLMHVLLLGIAPTVVIAKLRLKPLSIKRAIIQKFVTLLASLALIALCLIPFGDQYASFFRQHKQVRSYTNPLTPVYAVIKLGMDTYADFRHPDTLIPHAIDARKISNGQLGINQSKPKLMVFVVGETARADHIGLNGYERNTTPLLSRQTDVYSFKHAISCGTSTAYSVPCMFSYLGHDDYDMDMAKYHENVLDTLSKQGVIVIWRDNNSSSKGVADRVPYQDYKTNEFNPDCEGECRDIGMLNDFDKLIATDDFITLNNNASQSASMSISASDIAQTASNKKDKLIVLHQMGNHGPAYYKRYPKKFEKFTPVCTSNELSKCDIQSVINAYDNAIIYTDYFLNAIIEKLKKYQDTHDVVMIYISDHGESLGENNLYLHGLPYAIAPDAQKHVPLIIWSPKGNSVDTNSIKSQLDKQVSHDGITPTLLNFFAIHTQEVDNHAVFFTTQP